MHKPRPTDTRFLLALPSPRRQPPSVMKTAVALLLLLTLPAHTAPKPPAQPAKGPGGSTYPHADVRETEHGAAGQRYWLFEPARPAPKTAPLVIFLHGYSAMTPEAYRAWVEHIVRRGAIVIYPQYQRDLVTPPPEYHPNTVIAIRRALETLASEGHVAPDLARVAVVGHSAGGVGAVAYASRAAAENLPVPKAIMPVHAGQGPENGWQVIPLPDFSTIPATVKLAIIASDSDEFVGTRTSRKIWDGTKHLAERTFITLQADAHGRPRLIPGHLAPLAQDRFTANALDFLGYWRLFDELCDAAFAARPYAPATDMGKWSDGTPVKPILIER